MKKVAMLVVSLAAFALFAQPSRADDMHKHCETKHAGHQHGGMTSAKMGEHDDMMQESIKKMQDQMEAAKQATEPSERLKLLQQHNESMRESIKAMREMMTGGMSGAMDECRMMHGHSGSASATPEPIAPPGKAAKSSKSSKSAKTSKKSGRQLWTCPMHPEVVQDHPGVCPKCGMDLVKMDESGSAKSGHDHKMGCMTGGSMKGGCMKGGCMQGGGMMGKHMEMMLTLIEQMIEHNEAEMVLLK